MIGRCPAGDPARIRLNANKLQNLATELESQADAMKAAKIEGAGGLVRRNWDWTDVRTGQVRRAATDLRELAGRMLQQAANLEGAQTSWNQAAGDIRRAVESAPATGGQR